ncbi:modulator protein [Pelagivirga sediminicola]|uniref:Modulator protein n=1 Tax=Pelagivirga sediminicola TaxID=2170575 RepID=A0A2T7G5C3_9RHOB|nr:TldD/PmbA family protein [Pelagivirga sediminicola]PVA09614.1 modulator protein [Pelagivirga sediminicola]
MTLPPLDDLARAILDAARRAGADAADAIVANGASQVIDVRGGALEQAERSESADIGLRVLVGQRQANISSSDIRTETLDILAERAVAMAREAPEDPHAGLADPAQLAQGWDIGALQLCDTGPEPDPAELQRRAAAAEAAALAVPGVSQVQAATAGYEWRHVRLAATNGFVADHQRTDWYVSCAAIAGTGAGMERDSDGDARIWDADLRSPEDIGARAGRRAAERLGARRPKTGAYPVLFDERISTSLIGHLLGAANGAAVARGATWLRDRLGKQVLPDALSIIEDPHRPRVAGSRPYDGEGLPTQRRAIVDRGVLTGWVLDLASARQLGMHSTGNAKRGMSGPPRPGTWNIALTQGEATRDDLIAGMGTGLLVTSMIGSTINPNTGDYSRGASGFWIENGEIAYPVNELTIAGNLHDMLMHLTPANDARTHLSSVVPSLLVEGMTLAGA